jgi:hypothetical protein
MHLAEMEIIAPLNAMIPDVKEIRVGELAVTLNDIFKLFLRCRQDSWPQKRKTRVRGASGTSKER